MGEWRYRSTIFDHGTRRGEWSASSPGLFTSGEITPGTHWIGDWVGSGAGMDAVEKNKICSCQDSNPGQQACSPSLSIKF
jgi:hypothetical protein